MTVVFVDKADKGLDEGPKQSQASSLSVVIIKSIKSGYYFHDFSQNTSVYDDVHPN